MENLDVIVRSSDRVSGTSEQYSVALPAGAELQGYNGVSVVSVALHGSQYNVTTNNNKFWFTICKNDNAGGAIVYDEAYVEVEPGHYSGDDLATVLTTGIPAALAAQQPTYSAIVTHVVHDDNTKKMTITVSSSWARGVLNTGYYEQFQVMDNSSTWTGYYTYADSLNSLLAFEDLTYPGTDAGEFSAYINAGYLAWVSALPHKLDSPGSLLLCSNLVNNQMVTCSQLIDVRDGLLWVPDPPFGSTVYFEPLDPPIHQLAKNRTISTMTFTWRNSDHQVAAFQDFHNEIVLRFYKTPEQQ